MQTNIGQPLTYVERENSIYLSAIYKQLTKQTYITKLPYSSKP